eukprot:1141825-Pelagomonas_calceolata.AAC.3
MSKTGLCTSPRAHKSKTCLCASPSNKYSSEQRGSLSRATTEGNTAHSSRVHPPNYTAPRCPRLKAWVASVASHRL